MSGKAKAGGGRAAKPGSFRVIAFMAATVLFSVGLFMFFCSWLDVQSLPDSKLPELAGPNSGVYILDRSDHIVSVVRGDENRVPVHLKDVAVNMRKAMLAAEDHRFYSHHGLDIVGVARALLVDIGARRPLEGASTITQQLAKNLFFKEEGRTLQRKIKESIIAWNIEMRYPKDRILEAYLNEVYFGNGAYGIERAAEVYFNKKPHQLNLAQSAFLAALVKAPSDLGAPAHRAEAIARQREILDNMVEYGYVSKEAAAAAKAENLVFKRGGSPIKFPHYTSYVLQLLKDQLGEDKLWSQGLMVYTNLDPKAQLLAEQTLTRRIIKAPRGVSQAALVSISVADGAVIALVGGVGEFWKHQFNRATNPHTAGSAFKPFVYLAALMNGTLAPDSIIDDMPLTISQQGAPDYSPRDFDNQFLGPCTIRKAIALSRNICAVRVAQAAGIPAVIDTARKAGISSRLDENLSLALGSSAVSPLEMAGAYSTLARGGVAIQPQVIRRVESWKGEKVAVYPAEPVKVFDGEPVAQLMEALQDVVGGGTGTRAQLAGRAVAGKTGTADQSKDIWFAGCTPDLVTVVWGGNDDNLPIPGSHVTGGAVMAGFWHDYMTAYYASHPTPPTTFAPPVHPLAHESDFSTEPYHPFMNAIENLFGGEHDRDQEPERRRGGGMLKRMVRGFLHWF